MRRQLIRQPFSLEPHDPIPTAPVPVVYVEAEPPRWEYKQVSGESPLDDDALNALGAEGWELAAVLDSRVHERAPQMMYIFKRPRRAG